MFEPQYSWILKLLAKLMNVFILPVLSTRCFHQWGGAKMMQEALSLCKSISNAGELGRMPVFLHKYHSVNAIIESLVDKDPSTSDYGNSQGVKNRPTISESYGLNTNKKGKPTWKKNFSVY